MAGKRTPQQKEKQISTTPTLSISIELVQNEGTKIAREKKESKRRQIFRH